MTARLVREAVKTFYFQARQSVDRAALVLSTTALPSRRLYFTAQPLSRCNLYLITVGNILDLKSFHVKYRNIKKTSAPSPRPGGR